MMFTHRPYVTTYQGLVNKKQRRTFGKGCISESVAIPWNLLEATFAWQDHGSAFGSSRARDKALEESNTLKVVVNTNNLLCWPIAQGWRITHGVESTV